ncbi:MAG: ATP-binding protein [Desulfuromonadaceae bacterium]|nr:ATP-binding protein [Desulfuromonadaceae bacterium]
MTGAGANRLQLTLPSQLEAVDGVCAAATAGLKERGLDGLCFAVELVMRELLNNAILHGNRLQANKTVGLNLAIGRRWLKVRVEDQGAGFDWRRRQRQPPEETAVSGRGLAIARGYGERLRFGDQGRRVEVWFDLGGQGVRPPESGQSPPDISTPSPYQSA